MAGKLWLDVTHPKYADLCAHWCFARLSYDGGPAYHEPNLIRYRLEDAEDFKARVQRAARYNFTRQVVDLINGHLFKVPPTRKTDRAPEAVQRFWAESTRDGDGIDGFAREAAKWASVYGRCYAVVDVPAPEAEPETEYERQEQGLEPYVYLVPPDDVLDLAHGPDGDLLWIKVRERFRDDASPQTAADGYTERFRLWERGRWSLWEKVKDGQGREAAALIAEGVVPFDEIPVVCIEHEDGDEYASPGLVDDTVYLDRDVFNLCSELTETLNSQTFGQLVMPSDGFPPDLTASQLGAYLAMGKKRVFVYDSGASAPPAYIQPDASQGRLILETIQDRISQIYRSVNLAGEVGGREGQSSAASGVNMAYQFAKLEGMLATMAAEMQTAEREILEMVGKWSGLDELPEDLVVYPREFDVVSLKQALEDALSVEAVLGGSSPTAVAELRKQVIAKALDGVEVEVMKAITDEIDAFAAIEMTEPHEDEELEHDASIQPGYYQLAAQERQVSSGGLDRGLGETARPQA